MSESVIDDGRLRVCYTEFNQNFPDTLFHYTTAAGLIGILGNNKIWATHYRYLNDPSEIMLGIDSIKKAVDTCIKNIPNRNIFEEDTYSIFQKILDNNSEESFTKMLNFFIMSFSSDGDNLSLWRSYADDGLGFSIGFKQPMVDRASFTGFQEIKMDYINDSVISNLRMGFNIWLDYWKLRMQDNDITLSSLFEQYRNKMMRFIFQQISCSLSAKHKAYEIEQEFRIVITNSAKLDEHFRNRQGKIIPYCEIPLSLTNKMTANIETIFLGPKQTDEDELAVRRLLIKHGIDPNVLKRSSIPYRG